MEVEDGVVTVLADELLALWLHTPKSGDLFVPLEPAPQPFEARQSYPEPEFAELNGRISAALRSAS